ncbi:MAG: T9SS type A sorting domain-containing protein [Ignavibacteria bacterium]
MKTKTILFICIILIALSAFKNKESLQATHFVFDSQHLNSNNISTWYFNNGIFNNEPDEDAGFEWPKGTGLRARWGSGILLGAIVNADTLVAITNNRSEFLPGCTDIKGQPMGYGNPDYKIYKMVYNVNDSERIKWPNSLIGNSDQGAPVFFDSIANAYKPIDYANQTMFYSYTDSYPESHIHLPGRTAPLKADIKQINFSFNQPEELKNVIYQEFRIINRNSFQWTNAYINFYSDDDVGGASDDASGIDTNLNLAYTYNSPENDPSYGNAPPAVGLMIIRSPLVTTGNLNDTIFYCEGRRKRIKVGFKEVKLNSTVVFTDDTAEPRNHNELYNALRGLRNSGHEYINPTTNQPTKFVYSGDPVTNNGWIYPPLGSNAIFFQGFGPMNINPGDTQVIVIAQVIARGSSNINSITKLRETSVTAKQYYDNCFEDVVIGINNISQNVPDDYYLSQNYPNPFNPITKINYELRITPKGQANYVSLKVYDALGKEVAVLVNEKLNAGKYEVEFDGSNFASGIYFYSLFGNGELIATKKMLLIK